MDFVKESAKAFVGAVVSFLAVWFAKKGLTVDVDTQVALTSAVSGIVVGVFVWWTKNKAKS